MFGKARRLAWPRLPSWCRRRPKTALALGLGLCVLTGWFGVTLWASCQLRAAERAWQEDRSDDARRHLEAVVLFRPVEAHLFGARLERLVGNYTVAEKHLKECRHLQGMTNRLQLEWVLLRALQGEVNELEAGLWESIRRNAPEAPLILETLAVSYLREFRYNLAAHCLNKLLESDPDNLRALDWRSWVWDRLERKEAVYEDCRRALELCPQLWRIRVRLTWGLLADKNLPAATEQVQILRQAHAEAREVRLIQARWQMLQGQPEQARQTLDDLLAEGLEDPHVLLLRGRVEENPKIAEGFLRRALAKDALLNEAWYSLYLSLSLQGKERKREADAAKARYEQNERDFRSLQDCFDRLETSRNAAVLAEIGELFLRLGVAAKAERFAQRALETDRGNARALTTLQRLRSQDLTRK